MNNSKLDKDLKVFLDLYSKFTYNERPKKQCLLLKGDIDICDIDGNYWDTFEIEIYIDKSKYPHHAPIVVESSNIIKRDIDWHISKDGICCLDIDHEIEYLSKRGVNITAFYQKKIYPYFTNTLYRIKNGEYANGEYLHNFDGIIQFYREKLQISDIKVILRILSRIIENKVPGRNSMCLCGSEKKIKKCHLESIDFLKSLSKDRIIKDLEGFKNHQQKIYS